MAGIEKITEEILSEAEKQADSILEKAKTEADEAVSEAEKKNRKVSFAARKKADQKAALYTERLESRSAQIQKLGVLKAKQDIISDILAKAREKLRSQDTEAYFEMLLKFLPDAVQPEDGEMLLSEKDLARVPGDFAEKAAEIAGAKGGSLKLSKTPSPEPDGFLLRYGMIEINMSLDAVFEDHSDTLRDVIQKSLW